MEKTKSKVATVVLWLLFAAYLIVLFKITIFRDLDTVVRSVNVTPFVTIVKYSQAILIGNRFAGISNILGNLILFSPLGYMSVSLFPKMRKLTRILLSAFILSVAIEILQYAFACGQTDIDDVILNTVGGVAGYWIYILGSRIFKPEKHAIFLSSLMIASICIGFLVVNNYRFLLPAPGNLPARFETLTIIEQLTN